MGALNWPNRLTIARILLIGPFAWALLSLREDNWARWFALVTLAVIGLGDAADGCLARWQRQETALGKFLDPLADKLLIVFAVVLLAHPGTSIPGTALPPYVVVAALGKDIIVVIGFGLIYLVTARILIRPSVVGKACTACQVAMVVAVLLAPDLHGALERLPNLLWIACSLLAVAATLDYIRIGSRFVAACETETPEPENEP